MFDNLGGYVISIESKSKIFLPYELRVVLTITYSVIITWKEYHRASPCIIKFHSENSIFSSPLFFTYDEYRQIQVCTLVPVESKIPLMITKS